MPELPEVETVARRLQARLPGATIRGADVRWSRTIAYPQPAERFAMEVAGSTVERVGRRAKSVVLYLAVLGYLLDRLYVASLRKAMAWHAFAH